MALADAYIPNYGTHPHQRQEPGRSDESRKKRHVAFFGLLAFLPCRETKEEISLLVNDDRCLRLEER